MIPEISEFSYGFSVTNELVGLVKLHVAPIFPSLIEEGKKNGGYDVKLDIPGVPLYIQFKRADCLMRRSAREISKLKLKLKVPYFRFPITERHKSFQHASLLALDDGFNVVFYAAPRFHTVAEINSAWNAKSVLARSFLVSPREIGSINDDDQHVVCYDNSSAFLCSEPRALERISVEAISETLGERLSSDERPLRSQIVDWEARIAGAAERAHLDHLRLRERRYIDDAGVMIETSIDGSEESRSPIEIRAAGPLPPESETLRRISDQALHAFGAQLFVVQARI